MRNLTTYVSAAAVALSLAVAAATPASATTLIDIATSGLTGSNQVVWTGTGPGDGTFKINGVTTVLNFDDALFNDGILGQVAVLTLTGTTTGPLVTGPLPNFTQAGISGSFDFRKATDLSVVLLHGDFTNFWITGIEGDTSGNLTSKHGQLTLTSDVVDLSKITRFNGDFAFSNVHAPNVSGFSVTGGELNSFKANSVAGTFGGSVPEPASWALMIVGFGGVGAMVRRRKMSAALA